MATDKFMSAYLRQFVKRRKIEMVVVSSVVPKKNRVVRAAAGKTKVLWLNSRLNLGVGIDYPHPRSIGADRLANAAAVAKLYGCPSIVVDFGTAVTFDIISKRRNYIGGVIAPGLEAMTNFLYQRTALLPKLSLTEPRRAIGKSTIAAMRSGAVFGYRGLVREIITGEVARDRRDPSSSDLGRVAHCRESQFIIVPAKKAGSFLAQFC